MTTGVIQVTHADCLFDIKLSDVYSGRVNKQFAHTTKTRYNNRIMEIIPTDTILRSLFDEGNTCTTAVNLLTQNATMTQTATPCTYNNI